MILSCACVVLILSCSKWCLTSCDNHSEVYAGYAREPFKFWPASSVYSIYISMMMMMMMMNPSDSVFLFLATFLLFVICCFWALSLSYLPPSPQSPQSQPHISSFHHISIFNPYHQRQPNSMNSKFWLKALEHICGSTGLKWQLQSSLSFREGFKNPSHGKCPWWGGGGLPPYPLIFFC